MTTRQPAVGVVVVNWNDAVASAECIRTVAASDYDGALVLILVDSGSQTDPGPEARAAAPDVEVLRVPNRGYAAACNRGAALAIERGADHILFLNNDALLEAGALTALVAAAAAHPAAILAPKIVYQRRQAEVWSAGGYVTRPWLKNHHLGIGADTSHHVVERRVDWATGCALFAPVDVYRRLGPWDEGYFLYLEDTDWCLRGAARGVPTWFIPAAVVRHRVSASVSRLSEARRRYYAHRNHYRFAFRHANWWERPLILGDAIWTLAKSGLRSLLSAETRRDPVYHARTLGVVDFLRGRTGDGLDGPGSLRRALAGSPAQPGAGSG
jgi:GT2 family glycosyltransferase